MGCCHTKFGHRAGNASRTKSLGFVIWWRPSSSRACSGVRAQHCVEQVQRVACGRAAGRVAEVAKHVLGLVLGCLQACRQRVNQHRSRPGSTCVASHAACSSPPGQPLRALARACNSGSASNHPTRLWVCSAWALAFTSRRGGGPALSGAALVRAVERRVGFHSGQLPCVPREVWLRWFCGRKTVVACASQVPACSVDLHRRICVSVASGLYRRGLLTAHFFGGNAEACPERPAAQAGQGAANNTPLASLLRLSYDLHAAL